MISTRFVDNGISYTAVSTQILVRRAFGVEDDRILGLPSWARSDKYDIQARVGDLEVPKWMQLTRDQKGGVLLPILVSRFNLKFHHETKPLPIYALVIAKNGPKFHEAKPGEIYPKDINGPDGPEGSPPPPGQLMASLQLRQLRLKIWCACFQGSYQITPFLIRPGLRAVRFFASMGT